MTANIGFTIPGKPVVKQRPRVTKRGNTYTPKTTVVAEQAIRDAFVFTTDGEWEPATGPVTLELKFYLPDRIRRDIDNLAKTVLDALNKVAFKDDSQIDVLHLYKAYDKEDPRTEVFLTFR
jgi:crossover junction endodeoxyribonuclease RusA